MFAFLKALPVDYTLYSELQLSTAFQRAVEGLELTDGPSLHIPPPSGDRGRSAVR